MAVLYLQMPTKFQPPSSIGLGDMDQVGVLKWKLGPLISPDAP